VTELVCIINNYNYAEYLEELIAAAITR